MPFIIAGMDVIRFYYLPHKLLIAGTDNKYSHRNSLSMLKIKNKKHLDEQHFLQSPKIFTYVELY